MRAQKPLIIGLVSGYRWGQLAPFFDSLQATGYRGEVTLFVDQADEETLRELSARRVNVQRFHKTVFRNPFNGRTYRGDGRLSLLLGNIPPLLDCLPGICAQRKWRWKVSHASRFFHVANTRFLLGHEFLKAAGPGRYDAVLLTDVRDVVFQRDPFDFDLQESLLVFNEAPHISVDACGDYRAWIKQAYGQPMFAAFAGRRISCCGLTYGTYEGMLAYLREMAEQMLANRTVEPYRFGLDSAVHNWILWQNKVPGWRACENWEGPVLTMGGITAEEMKAGVSGPLRNRDGSVIPVIHQADRHPAVLQEITRQWQPASTSSPAVHARP